jgi:hypothetical protein
MRVDAEDGARKGTRWTRSFAVMIPASIVSVFIGNAIVEGVLAAGVNVANQPLTMHIDEMNGSGLGIILGAVNAKNPDGSVTPQAVVHGAAQKADITGLCGLIKQSVLGVDYTIVLRASGGSGENMIFDLVSGELDDTVLSGGEAVVGKSADDVSVGSQSLGGLPGGFGLDAVTANVTARNISGSAYSAQILGSMTIPHLTLDIEPGAASC